ncbi:MAG: hypothetical protein KJ880_02905, partial [Candidatus Omnitrophica bacterium]|nr:hypothetical protein [Candidatus Omnitrophota bacterium]
RNLPDTGVDGVPTGGLFLESIGDAASAQFLERFNSTIFLKNSGRILNMAGTSSMKNLSLVRILDANDAILATMGGYVATPGGLDYKRAEFSGGGEVGGLYFSQNPNGNRIGLGNVYMDLNALPNFINIIGENDMISLVSFMPGDDDPNTDDTPSIRVGIGTEGPTANLHVYNDDAIDSNLNVALFESNQPAGTRIVLKNNNSIHDTDGNVIRFLDRNGGLAGSIVGARKSDDGSVQYLKLDSESAELYLDGVTGNIGIGTTAPLGALDVHSTTTAFYPPRVTTAQRNAIASTAAAEPAKEGALVYNSETNGLETYNGSGWDSAAGGGVMPGTWCGLRMQGESEPVFYCNKTYDPRFSCPSGYSKISFEEVFFSKAVYICVKN